MVDCLKEDRERQPLPVLFLFGRPSSGALGAVINPPVPVDIPAGLSLFRGYSASRMAKPGQHQQQDTSPHDGSSKKGGGRQAVVELCGISTCGLMFWSRSRFDIGAEVQVRIQRAALPAHWLEHVPASTRWVMLQGLIVACPPQRREDGSTGFEVSLLIEKDAHDAIRPIQIRSKMRWSTPPMAGLRRFGLN